MCPFYLRGDMVALKQEVRPPPVQFPVEYFMPGKNEPSWPLSAKVVRLTLMRSNLDTLHRPQIAIVGRSDYYGWARYSACVSERVYKLYPTQYDFVWCFFYAFCEPLSDLTIKEIKQGMLVEFTLYVNKEAGLLRKNNMTMKWGQWCKIFTA